MKDSMIKRLLLLLAILPFIITGCNLPVQGSVAAISANNPFTLVTSDPNGTATPTPFQPLAMTSTFLAPLATGTPVQNTSTPVPGDTPIAQSITAQPGANMLNLPDGLVNILIFGSDYRPGEGYRTDTIILASINTKDSTVSLISFPRDLYINIPGWEMQRINTSQAHGGFALTQATFEYNFGIKPDHYVMATFSSFMSIIDYLGGIDVNVAQNLSDTCDVSISRYKWCSVGPGVVHMDSKLALWFVRSRHTSNDIERGRRAIEVLQAIFAKLISLNGITKAPQLYAAYRNAFDTDMTLADVLPLLPVVAKLTDPSRVRNFTIGYNLSSDWVTPDGAMVLLPNLAGIREAIYNTIMGK